MSKEERIAITTGSASIPFLAGVTHTETGKLIDGGIIDSMGGANVHSRIENTDRIIALYGHKGMIIKLVKARKDLYKKLLQKPDYACDDFFLPKDEAKLPFYGKTDKASLKEAYELGKSTGRELADSQKH